MRSDTERSAGLTPCLRQIRRQGNLLGVPKPSLRPDEREIATYRANRSQVSRAVGGHLLLTDQRLLFYPHKLDSSTGGKAWECDLGAITDVGLSERGFNPFDGSMRRRLRIESDGTANFFVVNKAESIAAAIRDAAPA